MLSRKLWQQTESLNTAILLAKASVPVPKSVISKLRNGRREKIGTTEPEGSIATAKIKAPARLESVLHA